MKTKLPKIPSQRQKELNQVLDIIKQEAQKRKIELDKIILFWSYARGDFVEIDIRDREIFMSDFDILVITKHDLWEEAGQLEILIIDTAKKIHSIEPPLTIIIESLEHVTHMLQMWRYFYADIKSEWILLHDKTWIELPEQKKLTKQEKLKMKKKTMKYGFQNEMNPLKCTILLTKNDF